MTKTNAWGEPVEPEQRDGFWVPKDQRKDDDSDPDANALGDTGTDLPEPGAREIPERRR